MASGFLQGIKAVWSRQQRNWKLVVYRNVSERFFRELTLQYNSLYTRALGATPVQLGSVTSTSQALFAAISIPVGWMHDRYSLRKLHVFGVGLLAFSSLIYALAMDWIMIIPALTCYQLAMRFHCTAICGVCLENRDRATAKGLCEGLGSIPSFFAPMIAAFLITYFGGMNVEGLRPLYVIQFVARAAMFIYLASQLKEIVRIPRAKKTSGFMADFHEVFERGTALKSFLLVSATGAFVTSVILTFRLPFAFEIKGGGAFILGAMITAEILIRVLFSTPLGQLCDRIGRKKVFYILTPILLASYLVLVLAPSPEFLILAGILHGPDQIIQMIVIGTMRPELVPQDCIGRWEGIAATCQGLAGIPGPIIAGIIWQTLGPSYVFYFLIAVVLFVSVPAMMSIPETLSRKK